jgi:hypothetical protein
MSLNYTATKSGKKRNLDSARFHSLNLYNILNNLNNDYNTNMGKLIER